jgi:rhodanese-related sulfurtransferase
MNSNIDQIKTHKFQQVFANRRYLLPLAVVGALLVAGAGTMSILAYQHQMSLPVYLQSFSTPQISVQELASGKFKSVLLIDVRSPEEYQEDHIGNSQLVPLTDIESGLGIPQVKTILQRYERTHLDKPTIILYCTSGMRSIKANQQLSHYGYQALTLTGGITTWRKQFTRSQDLQVLATK